MGTPSSENCSRVATPPSPKIEVIDETTKSGSVSRTASKDGKFSAMRGTFEFASSSSGSTGSNHVDVPTIRSSAPSESKISVELWYSETIFCGGASTVISSPQFSIEMGEAAELEAAASSDPLPLSSEEHAERVSAPMANRQARRRANFRMRNTFEVRVWNAKPICGPDGEGREGQPVFGLRISWLSASSRAFSMPSDYRAVPSPLPLRVSSGVSPDSRAP